MNHGDPAEAWRLPRIRGLLKGLPVPLGNGEMLVWVNAGDVDSMPNHVFAFIAGAAGLPKRCTPGGFEEDLPADAAELMAKLSETDEINAAGILTWLAANHRDLGLRDRTPAGWGAFTSATRQPRPGGGVHPGARGPRRSINSLS